MKKWVKQLATGLRNARWASALAFLLVFLLPALAFGADTPAPTALSRISQGIVELITPIVISAVGVIASWLLWKLKQKTGIQISDATQASWESIATNAVLRAAEWAKNEADKLVGSTTVPGPAILETAVNWAITAASSMGLPEKAKAEVEGLVEAQLNKLRRQQGLEVAGTAAAIVAASPGAPEINHSVVVKALPDTV
jgi:hypothetical protein